jgi:hypothetical protein
VTWRRRDWEPPCVRGPTRPHRPRLVASHSTSLHTRARSRGQACIDHSYHVLPTHTHTRVRSRWANQFAFRATFISSISFIHIHSVNTATLYTGKRSREEAQNPFPKHVARSHVRLLRTPRANLTPSRHPSVRGRTNWAAYTHAHMFICSASPCVTVKTVK